MRIFWNQFVNVHSQNHCNLGKNVLGWLSWIEIFNKIRRLRESAKAYSPHPLNISPSHDFCIIIILPIKGAWGPPPPALSFYCTKTTRFLWYWESSLIWMLKDFSHQTVIEKSFPSVETPLKPRFLPLDYSKRIMIIKGSRKKKVLPLMAGLLRGWGGGGKRPGH